MSDVLAKICADKREHVAKRKSVEPLSALEDVARGAPKPRGFVASLQAKRDAGAYGLIAEIKRASPSKGMIRPDFDPPSLAQAYAAAGAACLSVLTDEPYFKGRDLYLLEARAAVKLPVLRKDFMLDAYQIVESRALGADCILLIMAALEDSEAADLEALALELGMDVLVEVHNAEELERALPLKSPLLGINNRNLKTLEVDIATTEELSKMVPEGKILVSESGLYQKSDLDRMAKSGADCFLVGESLMRQDDVEAATRTLLTGLAEAV
ncbi:MAG: indole-3-glycerol phosphate synthase TrpC [Magnetovibrionaceae bacterium]